MPTAVRLAELARELGRVDRDWAILAEGNCSMLSADGRVTVKASGVEGPGVRRPSLLCNSRGDRPDLVAVKRAPTLAGALLLRGSRRPSIEHASGS